MFHVINHGEDVGYVIVTSEGKVIEFSTDGSPYSEECSKRENDVLSSQTTKLYYEPGYHGVNKGGSLTRVSSNAKHQDSNKIEANDMTKGPVIQYNILTGVPDYEYTYSCIPTAIGNVLGYWDSHGYPFLMIWSYTTMINEIAGYMTSVTSNASIPGAVHSYCHAATRYANNFTATNISNPSFTTFKNEIDAGRPCIVGFASGNASYSRAHSTCGVGYQYLTTSNDRYIYVHDAWTSTPEDYYVMWTSYNDFIGRIVP